MVSCIAHRKQPHDGSRAIWRKACARGDQQASQDPQRRRDCADKSVSTIVMSGTNLRDNQISLFAGIGFERPADPVQPGCGNETIVVEIECFGASLYACGGLPCQTFGTIDVMREDAQPSTQKLVMSKRRFALPQDCSGLVRRASVHAQDRAVADPADGLEIAAAEPGVGNIDQDDPTVRMRARPDLGDEAGHRLPSPEQELMQRWKLTKGIETAGGKSWKTRFWRLALAGLDDPLRDQAPRSFDIDAGRGGAGATGLAEA